MTNRFVAALALALACGAARADDFTSTILALNNTSSVYSSNYFPNVSPSDNIRSAGGSIAVAGNYGKATGEWNCQPVAEVWRWDSSSNFLSHAYINYGNSNLTVDNDTGDFTVDISAVGAAEMLIHTYWIVLDNQQNPSYCGDCWCYVQLW